VVAFHGRSERFPGRLAVQVFLSSNGFGGLAVGNPFAAIIVLQAIAYEWPILENRNGVFTGERDYNKQE
jgi:hypothetical protein